MFFPSGSGHTESALVTGVKTLAFPNYGGVGGGVGAAGDAGVDLPEGDLVRDLDGRLQAGAAGLLDVGRGRLRRQFGTEHRLAGQVEVTGVLEHNSDERRVGKECVSTCRSRWSR